MNNLEQFDQLKADISLFVKPTMDIQVRSTEESQSALETVRTVKSFLKRVEERRKELVGPLNEQVKEINSYAKKILEPLEKAETHIKAQLLSYERELEKKRQEELQKAEVERKRLEEEARIKAQADREAAEELAMFSKPEHAKLHVAVAAVAEERAVNQVAKIHNQTVASIEAQRVTGTRKTWTFRVTDPAALPDMYWVIDEQKIREAVRAGVREIPGLEIYQETSIAVR